MKHLDIKIFGSVQGVFFRSTAKEMADKLGLKGLVKNENDGSVYIEIEGDDQGADSFLEWCKKGPPTAHVEKWEVRESPVREYKSFEIR